MIDAQEETELLKSEMKNLKQKLKNKEDEAKTLREDKSKMVKEHMAAIEKLKAKASSKNKDGTFRIDELDKVIYEQYNNDLTSRLHFIGKILDWQRFA